MEVRKYIFNELKNVFVWLPRRDLFPVLGLY